MNSEMGLASEKPRSLGLAWLGTRVPRAATRAAHAARAVNLMNVWTRGIKLVLSMLILTILAALAGGVVMTFADIGLLWHRPVDVALRQVLIDTLILLAVVEVFKTTLTYFSEGRVKVTFIVDTILVVMLTEVISEWFKGQGLAQMAALGVILLILGAVRIVAVRCSPRLGDSVYETF